jgi:hypothetical protein
MRATRFQRTSRWRFWVVRTILPHFAGRDETGFLTGVVAVDFLVGMIHRGERGVPKVPYEVLIEGSWGDGHSDPVVASA